MALQISVLRKEDESVVILKLQGDLDTETYNLLIEKGKQLLAKPVTGLILDLESLDYISSMGISAIMMVRKLFEEKSASFVMVNIPAPIDQVFQTVKALPDVKIFESMEEADSYFAEIQRRAKESSR
ncbi:MAG: STAS domain-containing protein [Candidatus Omnitrophota bacterium]